MDVIKAMLGRHSIRHFDATPVSKTTVMNIIKAATHCPSSGNGQPWELFVVTGATLDRIRAAYFDRHLRKDRGNPEGESMPMSELPRSMRERAEQRMIELDKVCKTDSKDPAVIGEIEKRVSHFCYAPYAVILCMPDSLPPASLFDMGLLAQNIMLAVQNEGLGSLVAKNILAHPDILRKELKIPDELSIVAGILIGHPEKDALVNSFISTRRPISEVIRHLD